jgi:hypothetical protein
MWYAFLTVSFNSSAKALSLSKPLQRLTTSTTIRMMSSTSFSQSADQNIVRRLKAVDAIEPTDGPVTIKGWVKTVRKQKTLAFVEVNDGSNLAGVQCVASFDSLDEASINGKFYYLYLSYPVPVHPHKSTIKELTTSLTLFIFRLGNAIHWLLGNS